MGFKKKYCNPSSFIILPNSLQVKHSQYKVPCCKTCNGNLGEKVENPISELLSFSPEEISREIIQNTRSYRLLFQWICLIFFKTHYKDSFVRQISDTRKESSKIGQSYCWHQLYHFHSMARRHYTNAQISDNVLGSIIVLEGIPEADESFDYLDNWDSQVFMIRLGNTIIFSVLNDSGICQKIYSKFLSDITGKLSVPQIRELFARLRYANQNLITKPAYYTEIDRRKGYRIKAKLPTKLEFRFGQPDEVSLFRLMKYYVGELISENHPHRDELPQSLEKGEAQFIFDCNGLFHQY